MRSLLLVARLRPIAGERVLYQSNVSQVDVVVVIRVGRLTSSRRRTTGSGHALDEQIDIGEINISITVEVSRKDAGVILLITQIGLAAAR